MAANAAERVRGLMPQLQSELADLVAIPSTSAPGFPEETQGPLVEAYEAILGLLRDAGVQQLGALELPDTAPVITGELPAPHGAPTVLLYGHYDVVPPGDESLWDTKPFEAVERHGAIYGRGTADSKSNILVHAGALRAWEGKPPVGIKLLIEGQEEVGSPLEDPAKLGRFAADALLIADGGNIRPGEPSLSVAIRGDASVTVEARTLASGKHSGQYGGAAPDALLALLRALASLHDEKGDVAVEGLRREPWTGVADTEDEFRELAEIEPGVPLLGTGGLGERLFTGPAITVTGIDAASVDGAMNAVSAHARAKLNIRIHPEQDAAEAQAAVIRHLDEARPFGVELSTTAGDTGNGFRGKTEGPAWEAMSAAMETAWGGEPVQIATGGAI
ncbi:MAG TPA: M20/M25/M40 family metallo-hydrolase, partial [Gaiellaceae bacterium]|nr:M20/M25/M40 family metallo-hydrolase [Gaiellaceae bacterium]